MRDAVYNFRTESREHVDILVIEDVDLPGRKSVTRDIDNVLTQISQVLDQPLRAYLIMYRDPEGVWDGVELLPDSGYPIIYSLGGEKDYNRAIEKLIARDSTGPGGEGITL